MKYLPIAVTMVTVITGTGISTLALHGAVWSLLGKHLKQTVQEKPAGLREEEGNQC